MVYMGTGATQLAWASDTLPVRRNRLRQTATAREYPQMQSEPEQSHDPVSSPATPSADCVSRGSE
jgi:hypothetical protein